MTKLSLAEQQNLKAAENSHQPPFPSASFSSKPQSMPHSPLVSPQKSSVTQVSAFSSSPPTISVSPKNKSVNGDFSILLKPNSPPSSDSTPPFGSFYNLESANAATLSSLQQPNGAVSKVAKPVEAATMPLQWNLDLFSESPKPTGSPQQLQSSQVAAFSSPSTEASKNSTSDDPFGLFGPATKIAPTSESQTDASSLPPSQPARDLPSLGKLSTAKDNSSSHALSASSFSSPHPSSSPSSKVTAAPPPPRHTDINDKHFELVQKMVEIGFSPDESLSALISTSGNMPEALDLLLHQRSSQKQEKPCDATSKLSKLTGILSLKHSERAEKLLNGAGAVGMNIFKKAKMLVLDSKKKISGVLEDLSGPRQPTSASTYGRDDANFDDEGESKEDNGAYGSSHSLNLSTSDNNLSSIKNTRVAVEAVIVDLRKPRLKVKIEATSAQLAQSDSFKEQGNSAFRQGQYGAAEDFYTKAILQLPHLHMNLVPLLNNRAASHLKNGNYKECVADCVVIEALCNEEMNYNDISVGVLQELHDSLSKALLRRGTAYENLEKWNEAQTDYHKALTWNAGAKGANEGIRRCFTAMQPSKEPQPTPSSAATFNSASIDMGGSMSFDPLASTNHGSGSNSNPNPTNTLKSLSGVQDFFSDFTDPSQSPPSLSSGTPFKSARVELMRQQDRDREQEDAEKLRLKDDVDAKVHFCSHLHPLHPFQINQWRLRKENNVRALISSLESILWEPLKLEWKPVPLSELITSQQVKVKYMKAIARLHPDKLSCLSLTVEQKLLANAIFSSLNDAWDSFRIQNQL